MTEPITIRAFRAIDEPETCQEYYTGHVNVLKDYGLKIINSSKKDWFENPGVYAVIAIRNNEVIGGVKIHCVNGIQQLPVEKSVGYLDENVFKLVKKHQKQGGAAEACGLWNARKFSGVGLSLILMNAVISICNQINVSTLIGLSSDHTLKLFQSLGYNIVPTLGNKGDFIYPTPKYIARVVMMDAKTLSEATPYNRERIFDLRRQPKQSKDEKSKVGILKINYNLLLPCMVKA